jgi:hypothetical protein
MLVKDNYIGECSWEVDPGTPFPYIFFSSKTTSVTWYTGRDGR